MKHYLSFCALFFAISSARAMEKLTPEIVIYNIAPCLDRDDRAAFKLTNNFLCNTITPQHILNEQYELACFTHSTEQMNELRRKGALNIEKEAYKLFLNNKKNLIIKIVPYNQNAVRKVFLHGIQKNNIQFMQWLLDTKKPYHESSLLDYALEQSESLCHHDIIQLIKNYQQSQFNEYCNDFKNWDETIKSIQSMPEPYAVKKIQIKPTKGECIIS